MEERLIKLQERLAADQGFGEKLLGLETPEEVQSFLKEQGLEFSLEEINQFKEALVKAAARKESGELSDEDLEEVAGGSVGSVIDSAIDAIGNFIKIGGRRW